MQRRLPAEWEEQDGILLAWPHEDTDWNANLQAVEAVFIDIATEISKREKCAIVARNRLDVSRKLREAGAVADRVRIYRVDTNDTWARDFGPIAVMEESAPRLLDFAFNGWGLKYRADLDNCISRELWRQKAFGDHELETIGMVLEGGSIESDGAGTILTTSACLMSPNRNPHLSREKIEHELTGYLGANRFLWLENGHLEGDDTDSHIDTLARFVSQDTIVHVGCDVPDDAHYTAIQAMIQELVGFTTREGSPYRLISLPWPSPVHDDAGQRLPATYANFLILNGAVLVPTYDDPHDVLAVDILRGVFPDREVIGIHCLPLIREHGSLHCVTMQLPKGTLP